MTSGMEVKATSSNALSLERVRVEVGIQTHINGARENLVEVGRLLNRAKDEGLVPHGEWGTWVEKHTGMHERSAQRLMQVARSVQEGTTLSQLSISKITAILTLPEGEREEMAKRATKEDMSFRALQEEIKREREKSQNAERELHQLRGEMPGLARQMADEYKKTIDDELDKLRLRLKAAQERADFLESGGAVPKGAQEEIERLEAELRAAEGYAEDQSRLRAQAQQELFNLRAAGMEPEREEKESFGALDVKIAVNAFIGSMGVLPHIGPSLARLAEEDRSMIQGYVDMVADWVQGSRLALATVLIRGEV